MSILSRLIGRIMTTEIKKVPIPSRGVDYRGKIVLAPMVRSGELPSRLLALHYGADLVWGPETIDKAMIGTTRKVHEATNTIMWTRKPSQGGKEPAADAKDSIIYQVHPEREGGKLIFQMGTANPELAVEAARQVAADVAGIDVNAGCPKPFSVHCGMGAALLRTPDLLVSILEALVKNIASEYNIGISVKIRILETPAETEVLVRRLVATGITGLTVHCRTTPMRPRERAIRGQLRMVADICHEAGVACVMNGDVEDRDQGLELMKEFGTDGAMIATCAEKNSSCFRSQADGGMASWEEVAEVYLRCAMDVENKFGNTKYLLCQIIPGKQPAYKKISPCKSYTKMCEMLGLDHLLDQAREVDERLGIDPVTGPIKVAQEKKKVNSTALAAGGQKAEFRSQVKKSLSERGVTAQPDSQPQVSEGMAIPA
ncbi:tRNA-dihydrouridine synthase [Xylariales sp. PMI_506]|nr:tRNA-dihydrouridine synthase [Xylariales sp. PMI_506]